MATVNLGRIKPVFRGAYDNSTAYVIDDIVTSGNETFIAIAATQGNATSDASKWTKLAAKGADGSDGTDVAATLANKEISFKTNAGALDGIPIGNAGEFLKVNSGATGYEFGAVSSDVVKLATASTTSSHSTIDVNGYFDDTTYSHYKLVMHSIKPENNAGQIQAKWMTSSSSTKDSSNYLILHTGYAHSSGSSGGQQDRRKWNVNALGDWEGTWEPKATSANDYQYCSMIADIINPQSTSQGKVMHYHWNSFSTTQGVNIVVNGSFFNESNTAMTGFRLYRTNNGFYRSAWELYGFKK